MFNIQRTSFSTPPKGGIRQFNMSEFCKMFCFTVVNKNKQYQKIANKCNQLMSQKNALFK